MSEQTGIQWTDSTWNIVTGCTRVSPGCARCYIERTAPFRMAGRRFARIGTEETTGVTLHWERLKKVPRGPKVFTPSLGDLFHEDVPDGFIQAAFEVMERCPDRIFQVLTKRPERALRWFDEHWREPAGGPVWQWDVPLPNVWLGVSIENARYTWRADVLREIPAAVRFISAEPLLGSLYDAGRDGDRHRSGGSDAPHASSDPDAMYPSRRAPLDLTGIDWVIVGGESGPAARPIWIEWAREILDACAEQDVAPFVKQLGAHAFEWPDRYAGSSGVEIEMRDTKGGDIEEWPADLRVREFPRMAVPA